MRTLLIFILFCFPLVANEEITVRLSSQEQLLPVYLSSIPEKGSGFDKSYLSSLEKVFQYDFNHNGKTEVVSSAQGASKIEAIVKDKVLSIKYTAAGSGTTKGVEGVALTGTLSKDRQTIHRLHDSLVASFFNVEGIASTKVIYTVTTKKTDNSTQWVSDVWECDYDGANARQATNENCLIVTPTFVPAKAGIRARNFLYVSYKSGQPKIFAANLNEGVGKRLTFLRGDQLMPTISPTLDKMAFISDITGNPDLFVQDFSLEKGLIGSPRQVFCAPGAAQGSPCFSPDGKRLAFVSNKDGTPRIYLLDIPAPGASVKNLKPIMITKKAKDNTCPSWSPDGKKIAYSAQVGGVRQIWIYDVATKEEIQLTDSPGHKENPAWAANSFHLMFNSSSAQGSDLYLMNLNQRLAVKITSGTGEKRFPSWEPKI